jgi:hypothetical protein
MTGVVRAGRKPLETVGDLRGLAFPLVLTREAPVNEIFNGFNRFSGRKRLIVKCYPLAHMLYFWHSVSIN